MLELLLGGASLVSGLAAGRKAEKEARKARREQEKRIAEILKIYREEQAKYQPTGEYGAAMFETQRKGQELDIGAATQQALRAGVGGVNIEPIRAAYTRQTGRLQRRSLEDFLTEKRTGLRMGEAGVLGGIQTVGPSYGDIASAYSGVGTGIEALVKAYKGYRKRKPKSDVLMADVAGEVG